MSPTITARSVANMLRKLTVEALGTAMLVVIAVGVATMSFGFGAAGSSVSAGVVATALAFGLVLLCLVYVIGPISGCHINPAVTLGALMTRRISATEAGGYWIAQVAGAIAGSLLLWAMYAGSPRYDRSVTGLGANGYDRLSLVRIDAAGAFLVEVVLTGVFVFVVLALTRPGAPSAFAGVGIGLALTTVHLVGIPLTGTSVNPARSIGPALIVGGTALSQLWLFIIAPLVGAAIAAIMHEVLLPAEPATVTIPDQAPVPVTEQVAVAEPVTHVTVKTDETSLG